MTAMASMLDKRLLDAVRADGGWGYYAGQASRVEPTAWAALALTQYELLEFEDGTLVVSSRSAIRRHTRSERPPGSLA